MSGPASAHVEGRLLALEHAPDPAMIEQALSDPAWAVRSRATRLASKVLPPHRLVALAARGDDFTRRASAMTALAQAGERALPAVLEAVERGDSPARLFCLQVLGRIRSPAATEALLRAAQWEDTLFAQAAIESLGRQADPYAIPVLLAAIERDFWRAMAAINALGRISDPRAVQALERLRARPDFADAARDALARLARRAPEQRG